MTKSELISSLADQFQQLEVRDVDYSVKTLLDAMVEAMAAGNRIEIRGFGSFSLSERAARIGRNPKSGEQVKVPGKKVPHFKAGKELRERVDAAFQASLQSTQTSQREPLGDVQSSYQESRMA
ncbi:integration host factor subunit beta [Brackiella oedipodis]|uniref:integration host factor subunit beta n=1 Tax=Brackiella oedipodis TaxID=124225 RepID=UPI000686AC16|nr:integration host factor subunit beta [Brackiella oedipodis]